MSFSEESNWESKYQNANALGYQHDILKMPLDTQYFIAVCKYNNHNYVMTGTEDGVILSAIGKKGRDKFLGTLNYLKYLYRFFFSTPLPAVLADEGLVKSKDQNAKANDAAHISLVSYRAYTLSLKQYQDYTYFLQNLEKKSYTYYNLMAPQNDEGRVNHVYAVSSDDAYAKGIDVRMPAPAEAKYQPNPNSYNEVGISNSCRHTALDILRVLNINDEDNSRLFFRKFPNVMEVQNGKILTPLFILPIPAGQELKQANPELYALLKDLRDNIVRLSQSNYGLDLAHSKVRALNDLYKQLESAQTKQERLEVVNIWKRQKQGRESLTNFSLMHEQRIQLFSYCFFQPSPPKSVAAIERIENSLKAAPAA